ncbi:DNA alkylation repair protein, partial [bacterium]|nr:DNA alkylation repair protein [bacterium]
VCDTLATQGIRKIVELKQKEIFEISKELIKSKNLWQRRFALVLLINFTKDKNLRKEIEKILKNVKDDKEHYTKRAIIWLKNELKND